MGRKSIKEGKNIYHISREQVGLTREAAAKELEFMSSDRIEKIESGKSQPHPDEIMAMAEHYRNPGLCNYYCSHECRIGQEYVPEVKAKDLAVITLEVLNNIAALSQEKDRLVEIAVDGEISEDELPDFKKIQTDLERMSLAIDSLKLWVDSTIAAGKIDKERIKG